MPQIELKYSDTVSIDAAKLFAKIESIIGECDHSAGACKSRAYPAAVYLHDHVLLTVSLLKKPHRNDQFVLNMRDKLEAVLASSLVEGVYYAIEINFSSDYYHTSQVN